MVELEHFEWFPINTEQSIILGGEDYILRSFDGTGNTLLNDQSQKAPFQVGETFLNVDPQPRRVLIDLRIADNLSKINELKSRLSRCLVSEPARVGRGDLGLLVYHRKGLEPVQLRAIPVQSPQFTQVSRKGNVIDADIEFFCPYPYWSKTEIETISFSPDVVGLEFEVEFPIEFERASFEAEIINDGDVTTPVLIRVFGELETFTVVNETIGEQITVTGLIAENQYVEIDTSFGDKSVTLFEDGQEIEDIMYRVDFDVSDFWSLTRGLNKIRFDVVENVSGSAIIQWQERLAGV